MPPSWCSPQGTSSTPFSKYGAHFGAKGMLHRLDLGEERSVGTWFSAALLATCALAAFALARADASERRGWLGIAGVIALLSLDEVASLHESNRRVLRRSSGAPARRAAVRLDDPGARGGRRRRRVAVALHAQTARRRASPARPGRRDAGRRCGRDRGGRACVEETVEMVAATIALLALLAHLAGLASRWTFTVEALDRSAEPAR